MLKYKKTHPDALLPEVSRGQRFYSLKARQEQQFWAGDVLTLDLGYDIIFPGMSVGVVFPVRGVGVQAVPHFFKGFEPIRIELQCPRDRGITVRRGDPIARMILLRPDMLPLQDGF